MSWGSACRAAARTHLAHTGQHARNKTLPRSVSLHCAVCKRASSSLNTWPTTLSTFDGWAECQAAQNSSAATGRTDALLRDFVAGRRRSPLVDEARKRP